MLRRVAGLLLLLATTACAPAARALGPDPTTARETALELLDALAARFGPVELDPLARVVRPRLAASSLVPSRVYDDPTVWRVRDGKRRMLSLLGRGGRHGYEVLVLAHARPPAVPGGWRGRLELEAVSSGEFVWRRRDELAAGRVTREDLVRAVRALLLAVESLPEGEAAGRLRASVPRAARAAGRGLRLEGIEVQAPSAGGRHVRLRARLDPAALAGAGFPRYAGFLERQARPLRARLLVTDADGAALLELEMAQGALRAEWRTQGGRLVPWTGPPRSAARPLALRVDLTTRSGPFRVGFEGLLGEIVEPGDGVVARFRREPEWRLPFLVAPLLSGTLSRPFEGEGARLRYALEPGPSGSLMVREFQMAVREGWVVRRLGGVVGGAVADFRRGAEAEADRFTREVLLALRGDVEALLLAPSPAGTRPGGVGPLL